jgi:flagellar motor switch protein FliN
VEGGSRVPTQDEYQEQMLNDEMESFATSKEQLLDMEHERIRKDSIRDLDFILDIPLEVSVELGRTKMLINDLLQLGQGSVIELNKLAGEPLEILVNRKLVARGEVVVVNEKFGVRLTDVISPMERIRQLA